MIRYVGLGILALALAVLTGRGAPAYAWTDLAILSPNAGMDSGSDWHARLATDRGGNWVAVWYSSDNLQDTIGIDYDILMARSTDNGATWSDPMPLNTNAATDSGGDRDPQVATDGAGNWVAVWWSTDSLGDTIGTDRDILVARSTDNGATWTAPAALNSNAAVDSVHDEYPQVATDGGGNWVAVWCNWTYNDILVARSIDNGATWTDPAPLNNTVPAPGLDLAPQIAADGAGNWVAVWRSSNSLDGTIGTDYDILVARSTDNGATWTDPAPVNADAATDSVDDRPPHIATDAAGNWVAAWGHPPVLRVASSTDNGATWTQPVSVNAGADYEDPPRIATDRQGHWVVVWQSYDAPGDVGTDRDILVALSSDNGGTWTDPAVVNSYAIEDESDDSYPDLVTDGSGNWLASWHSDNTLGYTIGADFDVLLASSTDNGATWTDPSPLNNTAVTATGQNHNPQVTTDAAGHWVAVWDSNDSLWGTIGTDYDIVIGRSTDNGATWSDPTALNTNAANDWGYDCNSQVATDGAGHWVAVWQSDENLGGTIGSDYDILVARSADNGATWSAPAVLNGNASTDTGSDSLPQVATDTSGNWVAVWVSDENLGGIIGTDFDILVARSIDNGASWTAPAALNTNAATDSGSDDSPQTTTDGEGHWIAVWQSTDSLGATIGSDKDILVARSTNNGATWTAPAALNTNAATDSGADDYPQVAISSAGGSVAVWASNDTLGGTVGTDSDILMARSTDSGQSWSPPVALNTNAATDSGGDLDPQIATDGAGNWVAVWRSSNSLDGTIGTDRDILVARSTDNGATWSDPAPLNSDAATDRSDAFDEKPELTTGGDGNWVAVWQKNWATENYDILYSTCSPLDSTCSASVGPVGGIAELPDVAGSSGTPYAALAGLAAAALVALTAGAWYARRRWAG